MNESYKINNEIIENYRIICTAEPANIENWLILGRSLVETGQYEEAEQALTKIFEEGRFFSFKNGLPRLRMKTFLHFFKNRLLFARAYADLAAISLYQGNLAEAERQLILALAEFEKAGRDDEYVRAANRLGMVYRLGSAFESAEELHYRAKALAEKNNWSSVLAESLGNLGMVYEGKERFDVALERHHEALDIYLKNEKYSFEAACQKRQIALCLLRSEKTEQSVKMFKEALTCFEKEKSLLFQSRLHNDLALAYQALKQTPEAIKMAEKAVRISSDIPDENETADNKVLLACLKTEQDFSSPDLEELLCDAIAYYKKTEKKAEFANASAALGLIYLRRREWAEAESFFKDSLHQEEILQRCFGMASDYGNLGLIAQKRGNIVKAAEYWHKASVLFDNGGETALAAHFRDLCSKITEEAAVIPVRK